jgi:hypothetical protein
VSTTLKDGQNHSGFGKLEHSEKAMGVKEHVAFGGRNGKTSAVGW